MSTECDVDEVRRKAVNVILLAVLPVRRRSLRKESLNSDHHGFVVVVVVFLTVRQTADVSASFQ